MREPNNVPRVKLEPEILDLIEALARSVVKGRLNYWAVMRKIRSAILARALEEIGSPKIISDSFGISRQTVHRFKMGSPLD